MNTVTTSTTIHAAIAARRWFTHQRATRRISFLLGWSPRFENLSNEPKERQTGCRRPSRRTCGTPLGTGTGSAGDPGLLLQEYWRVVCRADDACDCAE